MDYSRKQIDAAYNSIPWDDNLTLEEERLQSDLYKSKYCCKKTGKQLIIKNKRYGNTLTPSECIELLAKLINEEENIALSGQYNLINLQEYEVVEVD